MNFSVLFLTIVLLLQRSVDCAKPYDYYLLQLTWPTSFCSHNRCESRSPGHFVMHGNWPNRFDRRLVTYCCNAADEYDLSVIDEISGRLSEVWPALKRGDERGFWAYQYKKHGACATETPSLTGVRRYFETTLALFERLDLDAALRRAEFVPTDEPAPYGTGQLAKALQEAYGVRVHIKCRKLPRVGLLENISFCFDKQLNPIDCPMRNQCDREFLLPTSSFDFRRLG